MSLCAACGYGRGEITGEPCRCPSVSRVQTRWVERVVLCVECDHKSHCTHAGFCRRDENSDARSPAKASVDDTDNSPTTAAHQ